MKSCRKPRSIGRFRLKADHAFPVTGLVDLNDAITACACWAAEKLHQQDRQVGVVMTPTVGATQDRSLAKEAAIDLIGVFGGNG